MSKAAKSVFLFAIYPFVLGAVLLLAPNFLLSAFDLPETREVWIRVVGMLATVLGYYYQHAARNELTSFLRASSYARCSVPIFFLAFIAFGLAPPILLLFGGIDAAGGVWTALCLRAEKKAEKERRYL